MGAQQYYTEERTRHKNYHDSQFEKAKVELPKLLLEKLILSGVIPGNECKCLDDAARKVMWKSLLQGSINKEQPLCL